MGPSEAPTDIFGLLIRYLRDQRARVIVLAVLLLGATGLQAISPLIVRTVLESAVAGAAVSRLTGYAVLFVVAATLQQLTAVTATFLSVRLGWQATNELRTDLLAHALDLDMPYHNDHSPGEMIERIDGDVTMLSNFFSSFVVQIVGSGLVLVLVLAVLVFQDWRVGLVMALFVALSVWVLVALRRIGVEQWRLIRQASGELFGFLEETLSGVEDIHASNGRSFIINGFYGRMRTFLRRQISAGFRTNLLINGWLLIDTTSYAVGLGLGALMYLNGWAGIGAAYLVFHYAGMLSRPLRVIVFQMEDFQRAAAAGGRAIRLLSTRSAVDDDALDGGSTTGPAGPAARAAILAPRALEVRLDDVTFGYDPDRPVLHGISIEIPAGEVLGLLGRTGSGKTTISRLLFRHYDVQQGRVVVGGHDVRRQEVRGLRSRMVMVNQRVDLVHGSVRDNLTLYDPRFTDAEVEDLLAEIGLGPWVSGLSKGIHTVLRGEETEMSAGQAQLLAFGRAFLLGESAGVVVLDEASSRLDPATEQVLERAVGRLIRGRTALIIAHRLSTVLRADRLALLEAGRVVESGPRQALVERADSRINALIAEAERGILE